MNIFFISALIVLAASAPQGRAAGGRFDYRTHLGLVDRAEAGELCLKIANPGLAEGSRVGIVSPSRPQQYARAVVLRRASGSCSRDSDAGGDDSFYLLKITGGRIGSDEPAIAFVGAAGRINRRGGRADIDLDGDGRPESFRTCASREGVHLTVWSGRPLGGRRRWHRYYYLGYDVEPSCTARDTE